MTKWRNIPTKYRWNGESMVAVQGSVQQSPQRRRPQPQQTAVQETTTTVQTTPTKPWDSDVWATLSDEEKAAAIRTEEALDNFLSMITEVEEATTPVVAEPEPVPDPVPTQPESSALWEPSVQTLQTGSAPIYPDGRAVENPNHLMMFISNGAEIVRTYTSSGWVSHLRRGGGRENPVPFALVEALIKSGHLREHSNGVFRGAL